MHAFARVFTSDLIANDCRVFDWLGALKKRNITLLCTHMYTYTCNKADDHTQVPVLNCNNYRVIGITRLG